MGQSLLQNGLVQRGKVKTITRSGFRDIGGPVDVIVLFAVAAVGAVGTAILVYTIQSLLHPPARD